MNDQNIVSQVNKLLVQGFEIPAEKLNPSSLLKEDLGLDSLDAVDMLVHLEGNLGVKIDGEKLLKIKTLQDVYDLTSAALKISKDQSKTCELAN